MSDTLTRARVRWSITRQKSSLIQTQMMTVLAKVVMEDTATSWQLRKHDVAPK